MTSQDQQRFRTIDLYLQYWGKFRRQDLNRHHDVGNVTATRIIGRYAGLYPKNIHYSVNQRAYVWTEAFCPALPTPAETALSLMAYSEILREIDQPCYGPEQVLMTPELPIETTAAITRAIIAGSEATFTYTSGTSGSDTKRFMPHAIFRSGGVWYVRGRDMSKDKDPFRTYRFNRIGKILSQEITLNDHQSEVFDDTQWSHPVTLTLAPHTNHPKAEALKLDLGLLDRPVRNISTNAVLAPFVLTDLRADCSKDGVLNPYEYPLRLMNRAELSDIQGMIIAPGYND